MHSIIETKNASLDTLAVTIRALHVRGKQMTLAVFRQLPVKDAYLNDGSLAPLERWGLVRYEIKNEGLLWLVASHDGILYRCRTNPPWDIEIAKNRLEGCNDHLSQWLVYEKELAEWSAERELPHTERRHMFQPQHPFRGLGDSTEAYEKAIVSAKYRMSVALRADLGERLLLQLPQLFIAV